MFSLVSMLLNFSYKLLYLSLNLIGSLNRTDYETY